MKKKSIRPELEASAERHGVVRLLHYSRPENLPNLIRAGAVLSRLEQKRRGYSAVEIHGWGKKGAALDDYICFCLQPPKGLLRKGGRWMVLEVDVAALALEGACYVPGNSARDGLPVEEILSRCDLAAFEDLFRHSHGPWLRRDETEILIPKAVPLELVKTCLFPDGSTRRKARLQCVGLRLRRPFRKWIFPRLRVGRDRELFL